MLQYLIILLDDSSTSYCHYENTERGKGLIALETLRQRIFFAMKENLMIQFVYPTYVLPAAYREAIHTIDHSDIVPATCEDKELLEQADVVVLNDWKEAERIAWREDASYVLRTTKSEWFDNYKLVGNAIGKVQRMNVVLTDLEQFTEEDFATYKDTLSSLSETLEQLYEDGKTPQLNLLTDRMMLEQMNNCNAGWENITLAPDGKFYICPAFYHAQPVDGSEISIGEDCKKGFSIGSLTDGLHIQNPELYRLDHAPLCRKCDAYQCKRCTWLNRKTTCSVNTPSHEQCVVAHLERNAARKLLSNIRKHGDFLPDTPEIKEIDYLDPLEHKK